VGIGATTGVFGTVASGPPLEGSVALGATPLGAVVLVTGSPPFAVWLSEPQASCNDASTSGVASRDAVETRPVERKNFEYLA
jgi:hypothetical protein